MKINRAREIFSNFGNKRVLVVGDIMLDKYLWGKADRISPEAPVPVVNVTHTSVTPGGAGNVALNLAGLGCKVDMAGLIGNDEAADRLREIFKNSNVGIDCLVAGKSRMTTVKTRVIAQDQQVVRIDHEEKIPLNQDEVNGFFKLLDKKLPDYDAIVLEDYNKGLLNEALIKDLISSANSQKVKVYVDPKKDNFSAYSNVRLFKPNASEFMNGVGKRVSGKDFELEGEAFRKRQNIEILVVTRGSEGISIFTEKGLYNIPTRARKVHDVSGAGDTVISIFSLADLAGASPEEAAELANYGAGRVCEEVGVVPINIEMLSGYLEEHNSNS